jgi:hypothetical protein
MVVGNLLVTMKSLVFARKNVRPGTGSTDACVPLGVSRHNGDLFVYNVHMVGRACREETHTIHHVSAGSNCEIMGICTLPLRR